MTYDRETALRLAAEAREDDERMHKAPWVADQPNDPRSGSTTVRATVCTCTGRRPSADFCPACHFVADWVPIENATGIARTRNNLSATADQIAAAVARIDALEGRTAAPATPEILTHDIVRTVRRGLREEIERLIALTHDCDAITMRNTGGAHNEQKQRICDYINGARGESK